MQRRGGGRGAGRGKGAAFEDSECKEPSFPGLPSLQRNTGPVLNATFSDPAGSFGTIPPFPAPSAASTAAASTATASARTEEAIAANREGRLSCVICLEPCGRQQPVWSCRKCWAVFHLSCVGALAFAQRSNHSRTQANGAAAPSSGWDCPECREEYAEGETPTEYRCWCQKTLLASFSSSAPSFFDDEDDGGGPGSYSRRERKALTSAAASLSAGEMEASARLGWSAPHSCSQPCGRGLGEKCEHRCVLLCHPGPCPPCPQMVSAECYCGKLRQTRRCTRREFSCSQPCNRLLSCGSHRCSQPCHAGPCQPCPETSLQSCRCQRTTQLRPCASPDYSCEQPCGFPLDCGKHSCERSCHSGPCEPCALNSGPRTCPCGSKEYEDLACDQKAPSCGGTCDKPLDCGKHRCIRLCHEGPCDDCIQIGTKQCRCGARTRQLPCSAPFKCESRCDVPRACGRHKCRRRCCPGKAALEAGEEKGHGEDLACPPPCELQCEKRLDCGQHKCEQACHTGPCPPCPRRIEVACRCGTTRIKLPCGRDRAAEAAALRCTMRCRLEPVCLHSAAEVKAHPCHFGPCPPCTLVCGRPQPNVDPEANCQHTCQAPCHSLRGNQPSNPVAEEPEVDERAAEEQLPEQQQQQQQSAWKPVEKAVAIPIPVASKKADEGKREDSSSLSTACPPCMATVTRRCRGGHTVVEAPCSAPVEVPCTKPCGQLLRCGRHSCERPCHALPSDTSEAEDASEPDRQCKQCTATCGRRLPSCEHTCPLPCHPGDCPPCGEYTRQRCRCESVRLTFKCIDWTGWSSAEQTRQRTCGQPCHKAFETCTHKCTVICHTGPCPEAVTCTKSLNVRCSCGARKEDWKCDRARAERKKQGLPPAAVKLLQCDDACRSRRAATSSSAAGTDVTNASAPSLPMQHDHRRRGKRDKAAAASSHHAVSTTASSPKNKDSSGLFTVPEWLKATLLVIGGVLLFIFSVLFIIS